jgi:hypothetical protein
MKANKESQPTTETEDLCFIGCQVPRKIMEEIDRRAKLEGRPRANWMRRFFEAAFGNEQPIS